MNIQKLVAFLFLIMIVGFFFKLIFSFIVVVGEGTLWHLQRFLQCIKYITLKITPHHSPLSPLP
jgi:hypothetical protein